MRVNMDSSMVSDPRFKMLGRAMGITWREAIGSCFLVWLACYERRSERMLSEEIDIAAEVEAFASAMIQVGLAHLEVDGATGAHCVFVHGVTSRIKFLEKQKRNGAKGGKNSVKSRKNSKKTTGENPEANAQANGSGLAQAYSPAPSLTPSPAPAPAPAVLPSEEAKHDPASQGAASPPATTKPQSSRKEPDSIHHEMVRIFCDGWFAKYASKYPFVGGKDGVAVKWFREQIGDDLKKFREVVRNYFDDGSEFIVGARHSIAVLRSSWARFAVKAPPKVNDRSNLEDFISRGES